MKKALSPWPVAPITGTKSSSNGINSWFKTKSNVPVSTKISASFPCFSLLSAQFHQLGSWRHIIFNSTPCGDTQSSISPSPLIRGVFCLILHAEQHGFSFSWALFCSLFNVNTAGSWGGKLIPHSACHSVFAKWKTYQLPSLDCTCLLSSRRMLTRHHSEFHSEATFPHHLIYTMVTDYVSKVSLFTLSPGGSPISFLWANIRLVWSEL